MDRRDFIKYIPASIGAIAAGCKRPEQHLVANVYPSENSPLGEICYYNSSFGFDNIHYGIRVKTQDHRPVKIDGNPDHPLNLGGSSAIIQASLYSLYDPDRFWEPIIRDKKTSLINALGEIKQRILKKDIDATIRVITQSDSSPILNRLKSVIESQYTDVKFINIHKGNNDKDKILRHFRKNEVVKTIISFGDDFLSNNEYSTAFATLLKNKINKINIFTLEPFLTPTGLKSEYRDLMKIDEIESLIAMLYLDSVNKYSQDFIKYEYLKSTHTWIKLRELIGTNRCVLMAGSYLSKQTKEIVKYFNDKCIGKENFCDENKTSIDIKEKDIIIFADVNPFYKINDVFSKFLSIVPVSNRINISCLQNDTSLLCEINIPKTNYLEEWEIHEFDKIVSIQQPVVTKLNKDSISIQDFLIELFPIKTSSQIPINDYYSYVRYILKYSDEEWINILKTGFYYNESKEIFNHSFETEHEPEVPLKTEKKLRFLGVDSIYLFNHTQENNPYLYELPDPINRTNWNNYALMNSDTARKNNLINKENIILKNVYGNIELPVFISNTISDDLIISHFGYGHNSKTSISNNLGVNIFKIMNEDSHTADIQIVKTGRYDDNPGTFKFVTENKQISKQTEKYSFYEEFEYKLVKWEMLIETDLCIGCSACVTSCQIENNIPVVGAVESQKNRNMHWIRVNPIFEIDNGFLSGRFEPILCQHCDKAPCESVCPVGATSHSPDGLNEMTYNRCIGARYCIVNCPYKIRNFNFDDYTKNIKSPLELILNKDVTVRSSGISEKCTFCVQRLNDARAKGDINKDCIKTACQEACPTGAITFGNIKNINSLVSQRANKVQKEKYILLEDMNTSPSITYYKQNKLNIK